MTHYYEINKSTKALTRALEAGFGKLIKSLNLFGNIQKITTKQDDNSGKYLEINIKLV